jgi:hypothetical protein
MMGTPQYPDLQESLLTFMEYYAYSLANSRDIGRLAEIKHDCLYHNDEEVWLKKLPLYDRPGVLYTVDMMKKHHIDLEE